MQEHVAAPVEPRPQCGYSGQVCSVSATGARAYRGSTSSTPTVPSPAWSRTPGSTARRARARCRATTRRSSLT